jgi:hypothetical protein
MNELQKILERVRALFRLAASSTEQGEIEAATLQADRLIQRYRIDRAALRDGAPDEFIEAPIGQPFQRSAQWRTLLRGVVAEHYGCAVVRAGMAGYWQTFLLGKPEDVEAALAVHAALEPEIVRLTSAYVERRARKVSVAGAAFWCDEPFEARKVARSFASGAVVGVHEALKRAKREAIAETDRAHNAAMVLASAYDAARAELARRFPSAGAPVRLNITDSVDGSAFARGAAEGAELSGRITRQRLPEGEPGGES